MAQTPEEVAAKWSRNASNATQDYRSGIEGVTENPLEKAAQAAEKMKQNIIKSIDDGSWQAGLMAFGFQEWRQRTAEIGSQRYAQGVQAAQPKMQRFMGEFLPYLDRVKAEVDRMPNLTLEDNINRMIKQVREVAKFNYRAS